MTRDECKKIIAVIAATYPKFEYDDPVLTVDSWYFFLKEYSYEDICMAMKIFVTTENSPYFPSPSQLIGQINKVKSLTNPQEVDVWREVRPAIRNGLYHFEEEFNKLSPMAKKMVGDPAQLREWAMLPSEDIDTVVQSNFKKRYETMTKRDAELNSMPTEVKKMLSAVNVTANQIEVASQGKLEG